MGDITVKRESIAWALHLIKEGTTVFPHWPSSYALDGIKVLEDILKDNPIPSTFERANKQMMADILDMLIQWESAPAMKEKAEEIKGRYIGGK